MNTFTNHQQEIARLKTLIPTADAKRCISQQSMPTSETPTTDTTDTTPTLVMSQLIITNNGVSSSDEHRKDITSSADQDHGVTTTTTHSLDIRGSTAPQTEPHHSQGVIIDEEKKNGFLDFVRNWIGGIYGWNGQPTTAAASELSPPREGLWNQQQLRLYHSCSQSTPYSCDMYVVGRPHQQQRSHHFYQQQQQQIDDTATSPPQQETFSTQRLRHQKRIQAETLATQVGTIGDHHLSLQVGRWWWMDY